ncbi:MAG: ATP-binding protein [Candidatus Krumholzibacteriia bacterium]
MHRDEPRREADLLAEGFRASVGSLLLIDAELRIVMASRGAGSLLGWSAEDLAGQPLRRFVPAAREMETWGAGGLPLGTRSFHLEIQSSSGTVVPVEVQASEFVSGGERHYLLLLNDSRVREDLDAKRTARLARLTLLNQVSEALYGAHLTLDQILEAVLICMTAGQGLRFNRAFLLLTDPRKEHLRGELAIGPSSHEEAARIWSRLASEQADLFELMTTYERSIRETDVRVNEVVKSMVVPLADRDHVLIRAMYDGKAVKVQAREGEPGVTETREWLGAHTFAIGPLTTRRGPLGVIIADNAITGAEIGELDLEFLQLFANQAAVAIENSRLYHELERRLMDLRKAHQRQKEAQETLLRMERLSVMGETSAIVAHELRNPLVAIGGFSRTLERSLAADDPNRRYAEIITEEVGRLERIIHELLDFIRPQKRLRKDVDCDRLVSETATRISDQLSARRIGLELDLGAAGEVVRCHPGEVQQVLQNLIMNAMQAVDSDGRVIVRTRPNEAGIEVSVQDTGPGIAVEALDRLFAPFFSTKPSGSGLGLTICARIVKAHGSELRAENRPEGGAIFHFVLPRPRPARKDG